MTPRTGVKPIPTAHYFAILDRKPRVCIPDSFNDNRAIACGTVATHEPSQVSQSRPSGWVSTIAVRCIHVAAWLVIVGYALKLWIVR